MTLSLLLNILDGAISRHGLITVLTTNHTDRIDSALKRPGRIDYTIDFKYAVPEQIRQMWKVYYPQRSSDECEVFISKISGYNMTIAQLQNYFFYIVGEQRNPIEYIDNNLTRGQSPH